MNEIGVMIPYYRGTDIRAAFREAAAAGIESCQLSIWDPTLYTQETADEIRAAQAGTGVRVSLLWAGWTGPCEWNFSYGPATLGLVPAAYRAHRLSELKAGADFAALLGVTDVATHVGFLPPDPTNPDYIGTIGALRNLCRYMKGLGLNFLFETGQETPVTLLRAIEDIGTGNVYINFDMGNVILYGMANPVDAARVFGKYVRNTHVKDGFYPTDGQGLGNETKVGDGLVDFPAVMRLLRDAGYTGPYTIEREISGEQQKKDILETAAYLRAQLAKLA